MAAVGPDKDEHLLPSSLADDAAGSQPYQPPTPKLVRIIPYNMSEFFRSCVDLYASLPGTDSSTYPFSGTPFGPEIIGAEDGLGGPPGFTSSPAMTALAACVGLPVPLELSLIHI